jgi:ActR/RegA family two-component response regulator
MLPDKCVLLAAGRREKAGRTCAGFAASWIRPAQYECHWAGLETVRALPSASAVVDLKLTGNSGLSIVSGMRSARPDGHGIIITGHCNIPTAVSAEELGASDDLTRLGDADDVTIALLTPRGPMTPLPHHPMELDVKG